MPSAKKTSGAASAQIPGPKKKADSSNLSASPERRAGNLEITYRDPASLVPYDRNARKHSPTQVRQLRAAIDKFGFTNPILCRLNGKGQVCIGAGHGRQMASLLEPALETVPTITISGLNDADWRALILADNKLALNAEWDTKMLAAELHDLGVADFDVAVIGFTHGELADLSEIPDAGGGGAADDPATVTCPKCQHCFVPE